MHIRSFTAERFEGFVEGKKLFIVDLANWRNRTRRDALVAVASKSRMATIYTRRDAVLYSFPGLTFGDSEGSIQLLKS